MKHRQFYFIKAKGMVTDSQLSIYKELEDDSRVMSVETNPTGDNKILFFLKKLHYSKKANSVIRLPFKKIWGEPLKKISWDENIQHIFIIPHAVLNFLNIDFMLNQKKRYDVKYCLIILDYWDSSFCDRARAFVKQNVFDIVYTFDPVDAKKYGFIFYDTPYSILLKDYKNGVTKDMYFLGNAKNRLSILHEIYLAAKRNSVDTQMRITGVSEKLFDTDIIYNQHIDYIDSLSEMASANCILEVMNDGQSGATLRYYESVCYNKKLLTNNKNVVKLPFYNPDYIQVFEKPEDIDWEWVKEHTSVDYHYDGRFSPVKILDSIISKLDNDNV